MTVRVTTLSGSAGGIGEYYGEQLGGYYSDGGPGGFWLGRGAEILGLEGRPSAEQIATLMTGHSPTTGERLGRRFRENLEPGQNPSVRGFDATFSVPKDISVLWTLGSLETQVAIEEAVNAAAVAVIAQFDELAPIRARGAVRSGSGLAIAVIPEHTSRVGDPNLHVHAVISSKVQDPETGRWYALDARELKLHQQMMAAQFHRGLEAELSARLQVSWGVRTQAYAAPLTGSNPELCEALSKRTKAVNRRLEAKLERFELAFGRAPSEQELWRIKREAAAESRPSKTSINEIDARRNWHRVAEDFGGIEAVLAPILEARVAPQTLTRERLREVAEASLAELSEKRSSWRRGHLVTEIARNLPSGLNLSAAQVVGLTNAAADGLLGLDQVVAVGNSEAAVTQLYTTAEALQEELVVIEWATDAVQPFPGDRSVDQMKQQVARFAERELSDGQLAAAAVAAGDGQFVPIVGPAGTGKTTALKAAVDSLGSERRAVFGLAPSSVAAQVLADETGCTTDNVTKFLLEHTNPNREPAQQFRLPVGATLLVDEAGMVRTTDWARLCALAETNRWRIVAVGDGFQFSAVGRGGMFEHLTTALPSERITHIGRVHRFVNQWEADASLKLRKGDTDAIDVYVEHRRILAMSTNSDATAVAVAMWDRFEASGETFAVFSARNETVRDLNTAIQAHRGRAGLVSGKKMVAGRSHKIGVGDRVVTRLNDRGLVTDRGHWVRNRDTFAVTKIAHSSITVTGSTGTVELPADYVEDNVELGYAQTSHASQGRTVDHSLLVIAEGDVADRAGIYVPMTRGRQSNRAVVATGTPGPDDTEATDIITDALQRRWIDTPAMSEMADTPTEQRTAARTALDHVKKMAKHNRRHNRQSTHPLHSARRKQLARRHNELFDLSNQPASVTPSPALTRLRPSIAPSRPDDHGIDI